jgi:hypothetical protein
VTSTVIILAVFLFALVLASHRRNMASRRYLPPDHDRDLADLRDAYAAGAISLRQFEDQVEDVLEDESRMRAAGAKASGYSVPDAKARTDRADVRQVRLD